MKKLLLSIIAILAVLHPASAQSDDYSVLFHATGPAPDSWFGNDMSYCGDVNGDGCDEFMIRKNEPYEVWFYYGGSPMDTIPDLVFSQPGGSSYGSGLTYGTNISSHDYGSILLSHKYHYDTSYVYLYNCGPDFDNLFDLVLLGEDEGFIPGFGTQTSVGNVNGDNYNDAIVSSANWTDTNYGKIYVYFGGPDMDGLPDFTMASEYNEWGGLFGANLDCRGDVNNDGYDDILVASGTSSDPRISLFYGGEELDSIPDWSYIEDDLIPLCASVPGLNGDTYADIVVREGDSLLVFFGGETINESPDQKTYYTGVTPEYAGDVDNDGYDDMIGFKNSINRFYIIHGSSEGAVVDTWFDTPSPRGVTYAGDIDGTGAIDIAVHTWSPNYYGQVHIYGDSTITAVNRKPGIENRTFTLMPNYPNPFNAQTVIPFTLNRAGEVSLNIFDITGRSVGVQYIEPLQAGMHEFVWNAEGMASGTYLVRLTVDGRVSTAESRHHTSARKVVLVK